MIDIQKLIDINLKRLELAEEKGLENDIRAFKYIVEELRKLKC